MEPLIRAGDFVEVRPGDAVESGNVVLARDGSGGLVCHRVLERRGESVHLAGDRSSMMRRTSRDSLLGVVHRVERGGAELRLGGWWTRRLDRLQAAVHRWSLRCRGSAVGRAVEALRRLLLASRGLVWLAAAARRASTAGASGRRQPTSSR